jgi:hypothetical protein
LSLAKALAPFSNAEHGLSRRMRATMNENDRGMHSYNFDECSWFVEVMNEAVVFENEGELRIAHVGQFVVLKSVELFDAGQVVERSDIIRQLEIYRTGRISSGFDGFL